MNFFSLFKRKFLYKIKKKINIDLEQNNNKNLDELFYYYGSDKANIFKKTGNKGHGFSNFYAKELDHLKYKKIKILEIGSYAGASAAAFTKYFTNAKVYCFDINISKFVYSSKRINVYGLDINNQPQLKKALKKIENKSNSNYFDVIIDDGSHYLSDILFSIKFLFKYLKEGGFYIIEDFKHPNYYKYNKNINHILVDQVLDYLKEKKLFKSELIKETDQLHLQKGINKIEIYRGNLKDSDICFIKKN